MSDTISRRAATDALDRIFDRCEEIEAHLPDGDPDKTGYRMFHDYMTVWKYLRQLQPAMDDLIRREAASGCKYWDSESSFCSLYRPSAESELPFEIQDILDYLDTVLHPIISPEHWNVYSELHDMISMLPSTERHGRWINHGSFEVCSVCGEEQYGHDSGRYYCPNCGARMEVEE